jgi:hypothetical protein
MNNYYSYNWSKKSNKLPKVIGSTPIPKERKIKKQKLKKVFIKSDGEQCPHCKKTMQRRGHTTISDKQLKQPYYYSEWDYCYPCKHVQHYEKFKVFNVSYRKPEHIQDYEEIQRQESFLRNIN